MSWSRRTATQGYGATPIRVFGCIRVSCGRALTGLQALGWAVTVVPGPTFRPCLTTLPPVVLVHGWGGSFQTTWRQSGFTELLADAGREVIGVDLLGHGEAPKPHDPAEYADMTTRITDALPDGPVDIVGFSLGAITTLRLATRRPELFQRIVLSGIGRNVFERDVERGKRILAGVEGTGDPDDNEGRLFGQYATQPGNDRRRPRRRDAATGRGRVHGRGPEGHRVPGARRHRRPRLRRPRPTSSPSRCPTPGSSCCATPTTSPTPESFGFIDAVLEFLEAVPA